MNEIKAEDKVEKKIKDSEVSLPNFKGKLDLILRLIRLLIDLSIYEGNNTELQEKNMLINEYNTLFDKTQNDLSLKMFNSFYSELTSTLFKKIKSFNAKIAQYLLNILKICNKFIKSEINIGQLLNQVIIYFKETIDFIRQKKGHSLSSKLINEFYDYLDDISKKVLELKRITFPKKNKDEEEKLKEQEELKNDYIFSIKELKMALKQKEEELFSSNSKLLESNLDLNAMKERYEESNKLIENQKKINDGFKQMLEQVKSELKNDYSQKITNLENNFKNTKTNLSKKISYLETANNHLVDANKHLVDDNKQLSKKIINLEKDNKRLSKKVTNLENDKIQLTEEINLLKYANSQYSEKITNLEIENTNNKIKMNSLDEEILKLNKNNIEYFDKIIELKSNMINNSIKVKEIEIFNLESNLMKRIQEFEDHIKNLMALNDNNTNNNIKEGEGKELKLLKANYKKLMEIITYLEQNNKFLYDKYVELANNVRLLMIDYKTNHPEKLDDLDKNEYNYDFNFKK